MQTTQPLTHSHSFKWNSLIARGQGRPFEGKSAKGLGLHRIHLHWKKKVNERFYKANGAFIFVRLPTTANLRNQSTNRSVYNPLAAKRLDFAHWTDGRWRNGKECRPSRDQFGWLSRQFYHSQ